MCFMSLMNRRVEYKKKKKKKRKIVLYINDNTNTNSSMDRIDRILVVILKWILS